MKARLKVEQVVIWLIIFAGVFLSTKQFLYNRSLWLDEAILAHDIIGNNHSDLLRPLVSGQVAPILFLQIEKVFSDLIPNSEFGLRLFPLICFLTSFFLFHKTIELVLKSSYAVIFALSLYIFSPSLIFYSSWIFRTMLTPHKRIVSYGFCRLFF